MHEASKSLLRRHHDFRFSTRFFVGEGIDIGGGDDGLGKYKSYFPLMKNCRNWDVEDGDGQFMEGVADESLDFVHSSHCLEHLHDPHIAFTNWLRILKPGGYMVITVPDEDMYEQGFYPSVYNNYHIYSFTILKNKSWSPKSVNLVDLITAHIDKVRVIKIESLDYYFIPPPDSKPFTSLPPDQTRTVLCESGIEMILQKEPSEYTKRLRYNVTSSGSRPGGELKAAEAKKNTV